MARTRTSAIQLSLNRTMYVPSEGPAIAPGVLMVVGAYYPEITGGGLQCRTLIQALEKWARFTVLATTRDSTLPAFEVLEDVPVYRLYVDPTSVVRKMPALGRLVYWYLSRRRRFEIVHFHGFTWKCVPLVWLARWTGKRTIYKMTSLGADDVSAAGRGWLRARTLHVVDRVVSISPALSEQYRRAGFPDSRLAFIPNGVDVSRFHPGAASDRARLRVALGLPSEAPLVTSVGFFSRDKAPHLLVEAWCRARGKVTPPPTLLFIGDTDPSHVEVDAELVASVRQRICAVGAEAHVRFVEKTHDVPSWLQASDIFVLPSLREGLPNALLEAMACALPCVASRLPGITDVVISDGVNGLLVPPGDAAALERALLYLLENPGRAQELGRKARVTVEERYSITQVAFRVLELYHDLTRSPSSSGGGAARKMDNTMPPFAHQRGEEGDA